MMKGTLSNKIAGDHKTSKTQSDFIIKGPMGKGLDIQPAGVHIAFTAGTGILPVIDLVAYLLKLNIIQYYQKDAEEYLMADQLEESPKQSCCSNE